MLRLVTIISHLLLIAVPLVLIFFNSVDVRPHLSFHCKNYFLGSFLYYLLTFAILFTALESMKAANLSAKMVFNGNVQLVFVMVVVGLFAGFILIPPRFFLSKHLLWLLALASLSIFLLDQYEKRPEDVKQSFFNVILMTIALCMFVFVRGSDRTFDDEDKMALLAGGLVILLGTHWVAKRQLTGLISVPNIVGLAYVAYVIISLPYIEYNYSVCTKDRADYINDTLAMIDAAINRS
jgi:hypothetical protein